MRNKRRKKIFTQEPHGCPFSTESSVDVSYVQNLEIQRRDRFQLRMSHVSGVDEHPTLVGTQSAPDRSRGAHQWLRFPRYDAHHNDTHQRFVAST